jgi:hypothetical protein
MSIASGADLQGRQRDQLFRMQPEEMIPRCVEGT